MKVVPVIMAAGASTRMKSAKSKLLQALLGRSIIQRAYQQAQEIGDEPPLLVVGHQREEVLSSLELEGELNFVVQDRPLGTGDAMVRALEKLEVQDPEKTHLFVMGGDSVLLRPQSGQVFKRLHLESSALMSLMTCSLSSAGQYGRVLRDSSGGVEAIVEAKDATAEQLSIQEVNAGFYLIQLAALQQGLQELKKEQAGGEFYLTDLVAHLRKKQKLVMSYQLSDSSEAYGVNTQKDLAEAKRILQSRINEKWMEEGVCMEDPTSVFIDEDVNLDRDVYVGPNVQIRGRSTVAEGAILGQGSIVKDSSIGSGAEIKAYSVVEGAELGRDIKIGPYARLRSGTYLKQGVRIGNFVEVKNSVFEENSKANHLSYIGDCDVGKGSNIGAGTITCNYDGFKKHRTKIGENVFIGSNSAMVAPVELEEGSIVGAGSVITKSVPKDALAVERSEQKNLSEGASRFRTKRGGMS